MADPYQTLGVARNADEKAIKSAYRKLAKELHPDRNTDNPQAADRFSAVTNAYDLLSDKDKRARFDRGEIDGDGNPKATRVRVQVRKQSSARDADHDAREDVKKRTTELGNSSLRESEGRMKLQQNGCTRDQLDKTI